MVKRDKNGRKVARALKTSKESTSVQDMICQSSGDRSGSMKRDLVPSDQNVGRPDNSPAGFVFSNGEDTDE